MESLKLRILTEDGPVCSMEAFFPESSSSRLATITRVAIMGSEPNNVATGAGESITFRILDEDKGLVIVMEAIIPRSSSLLSDAVDGNSATNSAIAINLNFGNIHIPLSHTVVGNSAIGLNGGNVAHVGLVSVMEVSLPRSYTPLSGMVAGNPATSSAMGVADGWQVSAMGAYSTPQSGTVAANSVTNSAMGLNFSSVADGGLVSTMGASTPSSSSRRSRTVAGIAANSDNIYEAMGFLNRDLGNIVAALSQCDKPYIHKQTTADFLRKVSASEDDSIKLRIVSEEGLLTSLVKCLFETEKGDLQAVAAEIFGDLAAANVVDINLMIVNEDQALNGLALALFERDNRRLQARAAGVFLKLAMGNVGHQKIAGEGLVIEGLVSALSEHDKPELQSAIATTLGRLAAMGDDSIKIKIAIEVGAVPSLVKCSSANDNCSLQVSAVWVLRHLAHAEDDLVKQKIVNEDGALVALVKCLSKLDDSDLPNLAAGAFEILAEVKDGAVRRKIADEVGVIEGLRRCSDAHRAARKALRKLERPS